MNKILSKLRGMMTANYLLTPERKEEIRVFMKKWGWGIGLATLIIMVALGSLNPMPEGKMYDVVFKVFFASLRFILAIIGYFTGVFIGYIAYQAIESSKAGGLATNYDGSDPEPIKQVKILNRGMLLVFATQVGGLIMAIALAGSGGR